MALLFISSLAFAWLGTIYRDVQRRASAAEQIEAAGANILCEQGSSIHPRWEEILIGNWRSVSAVAVEANAQRGVVNDNTLSLVTAFPELQRLSLLGQSVSDGGVVHLRGLRRLQRLDLSGCEISDIALETIKMLPSLESLMLRGTHVTDGGIEKLAAMQRLQHLDVAETMVSQRAADRLRSMRAGLEATVATCNSPSQVQAVIELFRRNSVRFHNNGDDIILVESSDIRPWQAEDWKVLGQFPSATCIAFNDVEISPECIAAIAQCRNVWKVSITARTIDPNRLRALATAVNLTELKLKLDETTDAHLVALQHCSFLSNLELDCRFDNISRPGISALAKLGDLTYLTIRGAAVATEDLEPLTMLRNLEVLDLTGCSINDDAIPVLVRVPRLRILTLDNTQITADGAAEIRAANQIEAASWYGTGLVPADYSRRPSDRSQN